MAAGVTCVVAALVCMALPTSTRDAFAGGLRASLMAPLVGLQVRAELGRRTFGGHDAAVLIADSVALRALRLTGVEQENAQLRALMGLGSALTWGFVPAEALRGRGVGDELSVLLSAGRRAGVEPLSPVVTPDGLVGVIERADAAMSTAIVWQHAEFKVSAVAAEGDAYGIVQAHDGSGADRFFLEIRGVLLRSELKPGALIITSGLGGVYPRGIPIGTVVSELKTPDQWARSYLISPAVALANIGSVLVLRRDRARAGVDGVWSTAAGADSASKRIRSASDSLARSRAEQNAARSQPPTPAADTAQRPPP